MFHPLFVWKGIAAHAGGGQQAPEKSISDAEMYSGLRKHVSTDTIHAMQRKHAQPSLHLEELRLATAPQVLHI